MDNTKKKVLFFSHSSTGGAERVTIAVAKMLPKDKYEVKFVLADKTKGSIANFIPDHYDIDYLFYSNIWCGVTLKIIKILKREKPYAVFCSSMPLSTRLLLAAHIVGGIKTVIRNCNYYSTIRWDQLLLCQLTYKYASWIIAQQLEMRDDILQHIKGLRNEKVIVLQNPLDKEAIDSKSKVPSPYPNENIVKYVWVARFAKTKGQDVLAKAFVNVGRMNKKAHLYFIGAYNENDEYFQLVNKIVVEGGVSQQVHFMGFDTNPYRWVKHCDCFVLPSRIEGLPNSLIEAQYLGKPAVATACIPIINRIVQNGITGYVVPSENVDMLADAMMKAPSLGKIHSCYHSASADDFITLFK